VGESLDHVLFDGAHRYSVQRCDLPMMYVFEPRKDEDVSRPLRKFAKRFYHILKGFPSEQNALGRPILDKTWRLKSSVVLGEALVFTLARRSWRFRAITQQIYRDGEDIGVNGCATIPVRVICEPDQNFLSQILRFGAITDAPVEIREERRTIAVIQLTDEPGSILVVRRAVAHVGPLRQ